MEREQLLLEPLPGYEPEIGIFLAALNDARHRTKEKLADLPGEAIDATVPGHANSIGTLLYHIAAIEMDWLYVEILEQEFPEHVVALLPHEVRDRQGALTTVTGLTLTQHLERLDATRHIFMEELSELPRSEFYRARRLEAYDVTPAWVIQHLMQHEAAHRGQMLSLRAELEGAQSGGW